MKHLQGAKELADADVALPSAPAARKGFAAVVVTARAVRTTDAGTAVMLARHIFRKTPEWNSPGLNSAVREAHICLIYMSYCRYNSKWFAKSV
jgi:hypothetical protein